MAAALLAMVVYGSLAYGQYDANQNRRRLGILGGLAGAAAGAAIGEDDGDAVPGALIGGAIGALGGVGVGSAIDARENENRYYAAQAQQRQAQAVTMADVVSMTHAGLSDAVIINHIQTHGVARPVSASDLIVLKQQGVSDAVLSSMQSIPQPTTVIRQPAPVIVEEHYYSRPDPWWYGHGHYHYHHRHYHRPHDHVHFGIQIGH
jgi:hypothetical protein